MHTELEARSDRSPILRKALAGLVLVGAVAIGIFVLIGIVKAIFWTVVTIVVVLAVLWALKTLLW
jgi:uncharacterized membrane protein YgaE (UPF0421/DUF939 family)